MDRNKGLAFFNALLRSLELPGGSDGSEDWLTRLLQATAEATGARCAYLGRVSPEGWTQFARGPDGRRQSETRKLSGLARRMAAGGGAILEPRLRRGSHFRAIIDGVAGFRADGYAAAPVPGTGRAAVWLVALRGGDEPLFTAETLFCLDLSAAAAAIALRNEDRWRELEGLAMTDGLTHIPNYRFLRQAVDAEIAGALRRDEFFTVVMVDVDNLKSYNEAHGHLAGSEILKDVARILRDSVRRSDIVGKYGGDEFLIILPRTRPAGGVVLADRVRRRIGERLRGRGGELLSCSFGVAGFPEHGCDFESLIRVADRALYRAKIGGRNAVVSLAEGSGGAGGEEYTRVGANAGPAGPPGPSSSPRLRAPSSSPGLPGPSSSPGLLGPSVPAAPLGRLEPPAGALELEAAVPHAPADAAAAENGVEPPEVGGAHGREGGREEEREAA